MIINMLEISATAAKVKTLICCPAADRLLQSDMTVCPSDCLTDCLSVCLSVCLSLLL